MISSVRSQEKPSSTSAVAKGLRRLKWLNEEPSGLSVSIFVRTFCKKRDRKRSPQAFKIPVYSLLRQENLQTLSFPSTASKHFADPAGALRLMNMLLQPAGEMLVSFGPTWYHPLGGHLFSVFPWAHLIFNQEALIRWRSTFKADGATRFSEVAGGLNQMTIRKFEALIENSTFRLATLELVPIKKFRRFHSRLTREFTTAIVRCHLVKENSLRAKIPEGEVAA